MSDVVVDASVVGIALFDEPSADKAEKLLASGETLHVPDLIYPEVGNILWKRHERKEITPKEAADLYADFLKLPLTPTPCRDLSEAALQLALTTKRTVYDCVYISLAIAQSVQVVTGDKRLVNALKPTPLAKHLMWIGDL